MEVLWHFRRLAGQQNKLNGFVMNETEIPRKPCHMEQLRQISNYEQQIVL